MTATSDTHAFNAAQSNAAALLVSERQRRIIALVFPELLLELATQNEPHKQTKSKKVRPAAIAVVCEEELSLPSSGQDRSGVEQETALSIDSKTRIAAVNAYAAQRGIRAAQTIAEARGRIAHLTVRFVPKARVRESLNAIAESVARFGISVSVAGLDTIWIDITGVAHLAGGEAVLLEEIGSVLSGSGHQVNACSAWGPFFARALAQHANGRTSKPLRLIASKQKLGHYLQRLPLTALPLADKELQWFVKLGLYSCADLLQLETKALVTRLGEAAPKLLSLLRGEDSDPLCVYTPQEQLKEEQLWEDPVTGAAALLFVARGLCTRLSARLEGRGLATQCLRATVTYDPAIARFNGHAANLSFELTLASPLYRSEELFRILSARLSKTELNAPSVGLALELTLLTEAHKDQIDLSAALSSLHAVDDRSIDLLLTELSLDFGEENVGFFAFNNTHVPEHLTRLTRQRPKPQRNARNQHPVTPVEVEQPTRLFPVAQRVTTAFRAGQFVTLTGQLYKIQAVEFLRRLQSLKWWSESEVSRDYVRLSLASGNVHTQVLGFRDRKTGERYLQALFD